MTTEEHVYNPSHYTHMYVGMTAAAQRTYGKLSKEVAELYIEYLLAMLNEGKVQNEQRCRATIAHFRKRIRVWESMA